MNFLKGFTLYLWDGRKTVLQQTAASHLQMFHFSLRNMRLEKLIQKHRPTSGQLVLGGTQSCENVIRKAMELPGGNGVRLSSSLDVPIEHLIILRSISVCIII